jgi:hypothetical protein
MGLYEWRGDVWGVLSGAGHRRGYVTGTRTGDEVMLALATLDDAGRARGLEVRGVVLEHDGEVALDVDWDIAPARLVSAGWLDPGGPPPLPDARPGPTGVVRVCVGFVMLAHFDDPAHELYHRYHGWYLWPLLIGAPHQRRGYATRPAACA